ncbi:heparinase II/III domain-containing protein [Thaumasiovibrio subtropicus]|uniref:heparinase II/III domain-containing protein n=1 Tax=Thaumasiovibrio subtropicus TaxID=1891207 RepID=UPI000B3590EF|nr:heparinase II/III family protein [Thaumasiovibrio subtropicus]
MLQFTEQEMARIKARCDQGTIDALIKNNHVVLNSETLVPPDARATWNHYYFCPDHGVRLEWDRDNSKEHRCPVDGKVFTGEPFDGAWWRWLNGLNAKACNDLGLLWHLTGDRVYLEKVKEILIGYADVYPDYEEHGGIPYNNPGKANSQTLCEANCHIDFARGYDFVKSSLSVAEQQHIEQNLLREGAEFMMQYRTPQLHNHEMKIGSTIGVIGLLLDDPALIEFAVEAEYGLRYQMEHGLIGEGLWFEGSVHYHYYALQALMGFELMARRSPYSLKSHPNFYKLLSYPLNLIMLDGHFPLINDCVAGQEVLNQSYLFEYAYAEFNDPLFGRALKNIYQNISRNNLDALLYGVDTLPDDLEPLRATELHAPGVGITKLIDESLGNMMLLKHAPFGGEHDHYDRLGLILYRHGQQILPDLGTCGYGADLHYSYYKNSATHNTLTVNQQNQPPAVPSVLSYQQYEGMTVVDTLVDWSKTHPGVDSHTIVQWDDAAYRGVQFRRSMVWLGDIAIQVDQVENPEGQALDLVWHYRASYIKNSANVDCQNPIAEGPLRRLTDCQQRVIDGVARERFSVEGQSNDYQCFIAANGSLLFGQGPDNPATKMLSYMLCRSQEQQLRSVVVHDLSLTDPLQDVLVEWQGDVLSIVLVKADGTKQALMLEFKPDGLAVS